MTTNDLLEALARLRVETGSLACLGCGREHNCSTHAEIIDISQMTDGGARNCRRAARGKCERG